MRDAETGTGWSPRRERSTFSARLDVQLHEQHVVVVFEARRPHARELAQLELEVVDGPDGVAADRAHRSPALPAWLRRAASRQAVRAGRSPSPRRGTAPLRTRTPDTPRSTPSARRTRSSSVGTRSASVLGRIIANSSPPMRPRCHRIAARCRKRSPRSRSTASPAWWPCSSLMLLKLSRSSSTSVNGQP